ncbi:hypothetical protein PHMEG_00019294 [Phytophthora megakarya]|uniref:Uncharacterized protein n=1 Tax=Phytophthora megakarya TaxID=4795 RepID=A0A225VTR8_9STRA|nr:hypothetical protein PHMEG_00019294 [Phytophthora megakarya]
MTGFDYELNVCFLPNDCEIVMGVAWKRKMTPIIDWGTDSVYSTDEYVNLVLMHVKTLLIRRPNVNEIYLIVLLCVKVAIVVHTSKPNYTSFKVARRKHGTPTRYMGRRVSFP